MSVSFDVIYLSLFLLQLNFVTLFLCFVFIFFYVFSVLPANKVYKIMYVCLVPVELVHYFVVNSAGFI